MNKKNINEKVISGFGDEWKRFDQKELTDCEKKLLFNRYFDIFPWTSIDKTSIGFDLGCGSGRWASLVAPKVKKLICIDPSSAIEVARENLKHFNNCDFQDKSVDEMNVDDCSMDFGYSLGVLHHIPDTQKALTKCISKLKPGAPFLLYLYYAFDNRPKWFRALWLLSEKLRFLISRSPFKVRYILSQLLAIFLYFPIARSCKFASSLGISVKNWPLSSYKNLSFYTMRTDALDRFGTSLEQRFSKKQIHLMMHESGLIDISFSNSEPFWCVVGYKKKGVEI